MYISSKYNKELVEYIKSVGGKWDPAKRMWEIPDSEYEGVRRKAYSLGVTLSVVRNGSGSQAPAPSTQPGQGGARGAAPAQSAAPQRSEGRIWLGRSKDGRFLIMRINLVAFAEDVQAVMSGEKKGARFRVMAARPRQR